MGNTGSVQKKCPPCPPQDLNLKSETKLKIAGTIKKVVQKFVQENMGQMIEAYFLKKPAISENTNTSQGLNATRAKKNKNQDPISASRELTMTTAEKTPTSAKVSGVLYEYHFNISEAVSAKIDVHSIEGLKHFAFKKLDYTVDDTGSSTWSIVLTVEQVIANVSIFIQSVTGTGFVEQLKQLVARRLGECTKKNVSMKNLEVNVEFCIPAECSQATLKKATNDMKVEITFAPTLDNACQPTVAKLLKLVGKEKQLMEHVQLELNKSIKEMYMNLVPKIISIILPLCNLLNMSVER